MLQTAVAEEAGNGLDVGTVVENVHGEGVASTMPTDVFVDAGTFNPSLDGLTSAPGHQRHRQLPCMDLSP